MWSEMNAKTYQRHLEKELLPAVQRLYKQKNWNFVQENAPSRHLNFVQDILQETLNSPFIKTYEWLLSSRDCNLLDYIFGIK